MLPDVAGQEYVTGRGWPRTCYRTWLAKNMLPDVAGQEHVTGRGWPRICYRTWLAKNMLPSVQGSCNLFSNENDYCATVVPSFISSQIFVKQYQVNYFTLACCYGNAPNSFQAIISKCMI
jgi:hypothetical protein